MLILVLALFAAFAVLHLIAIIAPLEWQVEGHWRPIVCTGGKVDRLRALRWTAERYQQQAAYLRRSGDLRSAELYDDLAHTRALEQRLAQTAQPVQVRAIARVLA